MSEPARLPLDFRRRSHEQEWLDRDISTHRNCSWRARNGSRPTILDIGCGYGDLLRAIRKWSNKRNLKPALLGVDLNLETIRIAQDVTDQVDQIDFAVMDVFSLPPEQTFDIVVTSLVAHHLSDERLRDFLVPLERASIQGWLIYDLQRQPILYAIIGLASRLARLHPMVRKDSRISVTRSLTRKEWTDLIAAAGIASSDVKIRWFLFRFVIERRKAFPPGAR